MEAQLYKFLTPIKSVSNWCRAVKKPTPPPKPSSEDSDYEDISELAISILHAKVGIIIHALVGFSQPK